MRKYEINKMKIKKEINPKEPTHTKKSKNEKTKQNKKENNQIIQYEA